MVTTGFDLLVETLLRLCFCFLMVDGGVSKMEDCWWSAVLFLFDLLNTGGVKGSASTAMSSASRFLLDLLRAGEEEESEDWGSSWS